jgi:hypothetical protein
MKYLTIEVFKDGQQESKIKVPLLVLKLLKGFLSGHTLKISSKNSIDTKLLADTALADDFSGTLIEIYDNADNEKVVISVV